MKKIISIILVACIVLLCSACGDDTTPTKKKKKKIVVVERNHKTSDTEPADNDEDNYDETESDEDWVEKIVASSIGSDYYVLAPEYNHPGVVDLDAHYNMIARDKRGRALDSKRVKLTCSTKGVTIKGNVVTIPYSIRKTGKTVTVNMVDTKYSNRKGKYIFNFLKFSNDTSFRDEFDGDTIDTEKWWDGWYGSTNMGEIVDGKLVGKMYSKDTSGISISTSGSFKQSYGCFSSRIKMPESGVQNCGFWLCSDYKVPRVRSDYHETYLKNIQMPSESAGEIDIVEYSSRWGNRYSTTMHWNGWSWYHQSANAEPYVNVDLPGNFHIYSVVWTEKALYFYLDDQLTWVYTGEGVGPDAGPMVVLLHMTNIRQDDSWLGQYEENDYPYAIEWDWVRVWKLEK